MGRRYFILKDRASDRLKDGAAAKLLESLKSSLSHREVVSSSPISFHNGVYHV